MDGGCNAHKWKKRYCLKMSTRHTVSEIQRTRKKIFLFDSCAHRSRNSAELGRRVPRVLSLQIELRDLCLSLGRYPASSDKSWPHFPSCEVCISFDAEGITMLACERVQAISIRAYVSRACSQVQLSSFKVID